MVLGRAASLVFGWFDFFLEKFIRGLFGCVFLVGGRVCL